MMNDTDLGPPRLSPETRTHNVDHIVIPFLFLVLLLFICCISPYEELIICIRRRREPGAFDEEEGDDEELNLQSLNDGMWMKVSSKCNAD